MSEETRTIPIRWEGRGRRLLGVADGLSRNYDWPAHGAAIDVAREDAPKIMLLAKTGNMAYVNPAEGEALEQAADAMTAPDEAVKPKAAAPAPPDAKPAAPADGAKAEPAGVQEEPEAKPKRSARRKSPNRASAS